MSYVQNFLVDRKIWFSELFDKIIDDKNDEIVIRILSQFKEKHVVDAFFCYDVLISIVNKFDLYDMKQRISFN